MKNDRTPLAVFLCLATVLTVSVMLHLKDQSIVREVLAPPVAGSQEMSSSDTQQYLTSQQALLFKQQRDQLSARLNSAMKSFGQQSCEMIPLLQKAGQETDTVSAHGGWCAKESAEGSKQHYWDSGLNKALSDFFANKTVGSFGDGPGKYSVEINKLGRVKSYTAYDGAPYCEDVTGGEVKFLDLTVPHYGLPAYDWVISLEVGEHIPAAFEDVYLDNLVRHAKEGVVLSWAKLGQGGYFHVNNKRLRDVVAQMARRGFSFNAEHGKPLRDASGAGWLRDNIHVYRRVDPESFLHDFV